MQTYISLLRGINVSGQRKILMKDLITLYATLGFSNIATYLQSGNVVFQCEANEKADLSTKIEQKIHEKYSFEVPTLIKTVEEMEKIVANNPFAETTEHLYVTFLADMPTQMHIDKIQSTAYLPDKYVIIGTEIYIFCPNGYGNTKLSNAFFESKLKLTATTRNWKTVNELVNMGKER
jgi:uncharacterized protein (DUF1697 family)